MKESSAGEKLIIIRYALFIIHFLRLPHAALLCQHHLAQDVGSYEKITSGAASVHI